MISHSPCQGLSTSISLQSSSSFSNSTSSSSSSSFSSFSPPIIYPHNPHTHRKKEGKNLLNHKNWQPNLSSQTEHFPGEWRQTFMWVVTLIYFTLALTSSFLHFPDGRKASLRRHVPSCRYFCVVEIKANERERVRGREKKREKKRKRKREREREKERERESERERETERESQGERKQKRE